MKYFLAVLFAFLLQRAHAQNDTIVVKGGDRLVGDILSLDHGALSFKTSYATGPISLNWEEVIYLRSAKKIKLINSKGHVVVGTIQIDTADKQAVKLVTGNSSVTIPKDKIEEFSSFNKRFKDRLKLDIDLGYITTKESNSRQANLSLALKYFAERWEFDFDYLAYATAVDSISNVRANLGLSAKYLLPRNWFLITQANSFISTEQQLDYRVAYLAGAGKYLLRRNKNNLYVFFGGTYNREKYTPIAKAFKTAELFGAVNFEFSPLERISINSDLIVYPSLSETGRVRTYSKTDVMFNLVRHFRFGFGYVLNTDNKPQVATSTSDYIFNFKLGWSL